MPGEENMNVESNPAAPVEPEVPSTGAVFTFGKSKFAENAPSKFWIKRDLVEELACGDEHTAVVTDSGRLFTFGSNEWGQLGLGHANNVIKPSCVKSLKPDKVTLVACGRSHTLVYMESGKLYGFGSNADGQLGIGRSPEYTYKPIEIASFPSEETLVELAAGSSHSLAVAASGALYVWGNNTDGQLGLGGDAQETICEPVRLEFAPRVARAAAGYHHSALVTSEGALFVFGDGDEGKLGLGPDAVGQCDDPTEVYMPEPISFVSCGGSHTVAVSRSGKAYAFGVNSNGQLGLGTAVKESTSPMLIASINSEDSNSKIVQASCGENHTTLVTSGGHLLAFGDGRHGKLCLDVETMTNHFVPVVSQRFRGFEVKAAHAGGCHTMVVAVPIPDYVHAESENGESVIKNGSAEDVNWPARKKHRRASIEANKLPPIRQRNMPDPNEILNMGTDVIRVDNEGGEQTVEDGEEGQGDGDDEGGKDGDGNGEREGEDDKGKEEGDEVDRENGEAEGDKAKEKKGGRKISNLFNWGGKKKDGSPSSEKDDGEKKSPEKDGEVEKKKKKKKRVTFFGRSKSKDDDEQDDPEEKEEGKEPEKEREDIEMEEKQGEEEDLKKEKEDDSEKEAESEEESEEEEDKEKSRDVEDDDDVPKIIATSPERTPERGKRKDSPEKMFETKTKAREAFGEGQNGDATKAENGRKKKSRTCAIL